MATVTLSPKFQVVIPKNERKLLGLHPGDTLQVVAFGQRIELFKVGSVRALRGLVKGMNTDFLRELDEE
jgi:AbrB family looped-hinge helix DNA binding protein